MTIIPTMIRHQYMGRLCLTRAGAPFFVFVAFTLALMLLISQNAAFNVIPFSIEEAKAIKHKDSAHPQGPTSNEGNTIPSASSSSQDDAASPSGCINYNPSTRTITVSCNSARLTDIDNKLHESRILAKQSPLTEQSDEEAIKS